MYADDILLLFENADTMQVAFNNIERFAMVVDLRNMSETKVMSTRLRPRIRWIINFSGVLVQEVESFRFLGFLLIAIA